MSAATQKLSLIKSIATLKNALDKLVGAQPTQDSVNSISAKIERLHELRSELKPIVLAEIEAVEKLNKPSATVEAEQNKCWNTLNEADELYDYYRGRYVTLRDLLKASSADRHSMSPRHSGTASELSNTSFSMALPSLKLTLPKFDGDIRRYSAFKTEFLQIMDRDNLDSSLKMCQLKTCLIKDAANILNDYPNTNDAYVEAWTRLDRRYENKRAIVNMLFREIVNAEAIKHESSIRGLVDTIEDAVRTLKVNGFGLNQMASPLLAYILSSKLDDRTRRDWENSLGDNNKVPIFEELSKFLCARSTSYESASTRPVEKSTSVKDTKKSDRISVAAVSNKKTSFLTSQPASCVVCDKTHSIINCEEFASMNVNDRSTFMRNNKLCMNCLGKGHVVKDCPSSHSCKRCNRRHHSLIHFERRAESNSGRDSPSTSSNTWRQSPPREQPAQQQQQQPAASTNVSGATTTGSCMLAGRGNCKTVLLATAVVNVFNEHGKFCGKARAILDNCSQLTLITESFARKSGLKVIPHPLGSVTVSAVGGNSATDTQARFRVRSRVSRFELSLEAEVVKDIPYRVPNIRKLPIAFGNYKLADAELVRDNVDILIGGAHYEQCIFDQREFYGDAVLRNTHFGWVVVGTCDTERFTPPYCGLTSVNIDPPCVESLLAKYFAIEDHMDYRDNSAEVNECVEHFEKTYSREVNGRFVVRLPFRIDPSNLGESRRNAERLLRIRERNDSADVRDAYREFMHEYLSLGHMSQVRASGDGTLYFIPHQMVQKPSSTTTKFRVVFNASAKTSSELSLNDTLMVGPSLQPDLIETLIRFRVNNIAVTGDIEKMYRQILVHDDDRKYQQIVWRDEVSSAINTYQLNTVTYGTASASFLATKCLSVLSREFRETEPIAARSIETDFYMDDWLSGGRDVKETADLLSSVMRILKSGKFNLRKIISNSESLLQMLPSEKVESARDFDFNPKHHILGLLWNPRADSVCVSIPEVLESPAIVTKRVISSSVARIFDPLGILAPVTVAAKLLLQDCWRDKCSWDEPVSNELCARFRDFVDDLKHIGSYSIERRYTSIVNVKDLYLFGFADASAKAYCAVLYLCTVSEDNELQSNFVCAKTKVSSLKKSTIPRLELCAAALLAEFMERARKILNIRRENVRAFSDAKVVLDWLNTVPAKLETFVRNRVEKIRALFESRYWKYINTSNNPADLATRGISVRKFVSAELWKFGPSFLHDISEFKNSLREGSGVFVVERVVCEVTTPSVCDMDCSDNFTLISRYSSFDRLLRIVAYMRRFIRRSGPFSDYIVSMEEIDQAFVQVLRLDQCQFYEREITALLANQRISTRSTLSSLTPYLDNERVLRVGGRLENADVSRDKKHPVIVNSKSPLLQLIIRKVHLDYYHANRLFIINFVAARYWVVGGISSIVKRVVHTCPVCIRYKAETLSQQMGQAPRDRVTVERPFARVGVDFAGAFTCKCVNHRAVKFSKVYVAVFVCFVTRAVHLEVVSSLSTEAFLETLQRFIARRGVPKRIYSDNGTNFVGANNVILRSNEIQNYTTSREIVWNFIPPRTPHQGGLWESAVRSAKYYLLRATNGRVLNYEEYTTYFCNIEAIMNSRPICYTKGTSGNEELLTPAHLLVGSSLLHPAQLEVDESRLTTSYSRRYLLIQEMVQGFWTEWSRSYLNQLQRRNKWRDMQRSLAVGDIVIVKDDLQVPSSWRLARVAETFPDRSGLVRNVDVIMDGRVKRRNITSLVRMSSEDPDRHPHLGENVQKENALSIGNTLKLK